ncbi:hypothetical protein HYC85_008692 [Camellia sinensis]|uniref:3-beta hydroxysteroid dehydrogenase/isomerase domain-containing protein n=1 Tax=Camellia sinensis TaxID=4442 RepID=A0A7J7HUT6_CAMSI|nr:hypothetical protein HYC85_008692 [Camellia sinensis]
MDPAVVLTGTANEQRVGHSFGSVEIGRSESAYIFRVALPGVRRNSCNVKYTIQPNGKVHVEGLVGNVAMLMDMPNPFEMKVEQLCPSGPFHVTFDLPGPVDPRLCSPNFRPDGDVTRKQDVQKALHGADCVFHLASYGMSGKEMLQFGRVDDVNINGTCHVLEACVEHGVMRLVYVSTYNVVFGGKEIINGNETLPYFPLDDYVDPYSRSKCIAEQLVLKSNGRPLKKKNGNLYTCAIRPAAIYGPGEERHLPRIINLSKLGLLPFKIGEERVKSDWVYIDNLVLALILASMGLLDDIPQREGRPIAAGQPYFISDGNDLQGLQSTVLNSSAHYSRAWSMTCQSGSLAVSHALVLGRIFQLVYTILYPWLNRWWLPQPLRLPTEVHEVGVTHYFSFLKAKEELGYVPMVSPPEGMAATISYFQERKIRSLDGPTIYTWMFSVIGMTLLFIAAYWPAFGLVSLLRDFCLFFFRSMWVMRMVFILATAAHIGEAMYAWHLAKKVDPLNARGWFWQTLALGVLSLRFLLKRARK